MGQNWMPIDTMRAALRWRAMQLRAKHKVATPVNWKHGDTGEDVIIAGSVTDDDAKKQYPARLEGAEAVSPHRIAAERVGTPDKGVAQALSVSAPAARPPSSRRRGRPRCGRPR